MTRGRVRGRIALACLALLPWLVALSGCSGSSAVKTVTVASPSTTTTATTPSQPAPKHRPSPRRHRSSQTGAATAGNPSVDATTSDGSVISLDDGSVYSVDGDVSSWSSGDEVAVSDAQDSLTNLSSSDNASATYVGDTSDSSNVYSNTGDHTQNSNSDDGSLITLDDGSVWAITDAGDQATAAAWTDSASITVTDSSGGGYLLVNTDDQETVHANYVGTA